MLATDHLFAGNRSRAVTSNLIPFVFGNNLHLVLGSVASVLQSHLLLAIQLVAGTSSSCQQSVLFRWSQMTSSCSASQLVAQTILLCLSQCRQITLLLAVRLFSDSVGVTGKFASCYLQLAMTSLLGNLVLLTIHNPGTRGWKSLLAINASNCSRPSFSAIVFGSVAGKCNSFHSNPVILILRTSSS